MCYIALMLCQKHDDQVKAKQSDTPLQLMLAYAHMMMVSAPTVSTTSCFMLELTPVLKLFATCPGSCGMQERLSSILPPYGETEQPKLDE